MDTERTDAAQLLEEFYKHFKKLLLECYPDDSRQKAQVPEWEREPVRVSSKETGAESVEEFYGQPDECKRNIVKRGDIVDIVWPNGPEERLMVWTDYSCRHVSYVVITHNGAKLKAHLANANFKCRLVSRDEGSNG